MRVEYKACIPQYEATQHQDIQETHWGMHADKLWLSPKLFNKGFSILYLSNKTVHCTNALFNYSSDINKNLLKTSNTIIQIKDIWTN